MKKLMCALLAVLMLTGLVACGDKDDSSLVESVTPPASTPAPASSQPEPEPEPLQQAYLTGLEKGIDYPEGQRICAVMVNNIAHARPSYGLSEAKILVESKAEAGITRFMALYEDYKTIPRVGSLRSARDQFLQLLIPTYGFYVHEGPAQNQPTNWLMRDYDYDHYDLQPKDGPLYWDEPARNGSEFYWHNVDGEHIINTIERKGLDDERPYGSPFFYFRSYEEEPRVPEEGEGKAFTVVHSASYRTHFEYDEASGQYKMSMFNSGQGGVQPAVDANNNEQLAFDNVLVVYAPMGIWAGTQADGGLVQVDFTSGGGAFYFTKGGFERVIWRKGAPDQPLRLEKIDGSEEPVEVNPGTTYIGVVDDTESENFYATLLDGTSASAAGQGTVNPNEVDTKD
ncbi:MAG: DUF3048 domain-containing protein [Oscillospiraceae bacterium]|jgi:hypothetical protein